MKTNRRELWLVTIVTLLGTAVRIADLTGRSLWIDESLTLSRIIGSWNDVFRNIVIMQGVRTIDLHPPLYFAILKATGILLGDSEFTLKLVGAFASILLIPATYVLGRRLFSGRVGLLAAVLACLSPAYQWYGHELRMYTVVALLAALSDYALFAAAQSSKLNVRLWVIWLCITVSALFTHYSVVGLFAFQVLFAIVVILYKRPRITRRDIIIFGGIVLGLVAISLLAGVGGDIVFRVRQLNVGTSVSFPVGNPLAEIVQNVFNTMLFGMNASDPSEGLLTWFVVFTASLGLLLPRSLAGGSVDHASSRMARVFLAMMTIFPMLFVLLYYLIEHSPSFRYSILIVPAIHVLLARSFSIGLVQLRNMIARAKELYQSSLRQMAVRLGSAVVGVVALFSVMSAQLFGMAFTFIQTPSWQDDWRGMARYIRDNWQPGDVFVITLYTPEEELRRLLNDMPIPIIPAQMLPENDLARYKIISGYRRIWFANTGGVELNTESMMGRTLLQFHRRDRISLPSQTNILDLMLFEVSPEVMSAVPADAHRVQQDPAPSDVPDVLAYDVQPGNPFHRYPNMQLSLYWRRPANNRKIGAFSVGLRLKTDDQRVWADWFLPSGLDHAPATWSDGSVYREDYIVPLPVGLPKQPYTLELALGKGEKAEVYRTISQHIDIATLECCIRILRWPATSTDLPVIWQGQGAVLQKTEYPNNVTAGEILPVVLTWRLTAPATTDWQTVLHLDALVGGTVATSTSAAGRSNLPVKTWPVGEAMRTLQSLQLPFTTKPGWYRLYVSRVSADRMINDGTLLGIIQVSDFPYSPVATVIAQPVSGKVGEATLLGYTLDQPFTRTETLRFQVFWRVESQPLRDGVLFLHVVGPDGKMVAQDDSPPEQGKRSTLTYRPGEGISQIHRLVIPKYTPAGVYVLYVGVYDREGQKTRWPAQQFGVPARDDLLFLGTVILPPKPWPANQTFIPQVLNGQ